MIGLKGVSKSIIEIPNPDSAYFERAVFYLKPNLGGVPSRILNAEAERWIARIRTAPTRSVRQRWMRTLCFAVLCMAAGVGLTLAWLHLRGIL